MRLLLFFLILLDETDIKLYVGVDNICVFFGIATPYRS